MGSAWSKVENSMIIKCFAAAGISRNLLDPFADVDDSVNEELGYLIQQVARGSAISTYLESDIQGTSYLLQFSKLTAAA